MPVPDFTHVLKKVDKLWDKTQDKIVSAADEIQDIWYAPKSGKEGKSVEFTVRVYYTKFDGETPPQFAQLIRKNYKDIWKQAELIEDVTRQFYFDSWDAIDDFTDTLEDEDFEDDDYFDDVYDVREEIIEDLTSSGITPPNREYPILSESVVDIMGECTDPDFQFSGKYLPNYADSLEEAIIDEVQMGGYR